MFYDLNMGKKMARGFNKSMQANVKLDKMS